MGIGGLPQTAVKEAFVMSIFGVTRRIRSVRLSSSWKILSSSWKNSSIFLVDVHQVVLELKDMLDFA
jgi:hypothetical protein